MPRKSDRKPIGSTPLLTKKQQQLDQQAAQLKARLSEARQFLEKAPDLKKAAQLKQQREIFDRFNRPARLEGPVDFRLDYVAAKGARSPRKLRKERSKAPLVTLALLVTFVIVAYFAWKSIWRG
jgi:hypothetical protein